MSPVLRLQNFSVGFGERVVLAGVDLEVGRREVLALMGPGAAGKSTLLRTICGLNGRNPRLRIGGDVEYCGGPLADQAGGRPALVQQRADLVSSSLIDVLATNLPRRSERTRLEIREILRERLADDGLERLAGKLDQSYVSLERTERALAWIFRACLSDPELLCVDEPTADLEADQADQVLAYLDLQRERRAVLMVTHNQAHARTLADHCALLAGGIIQEAAPVPSFFEEPASPAAQSFVRTGGCVVPSPNASPDELDPDFRQARPQAKPPSDRGFVPASVGPYGFHWLLPGELGGTPMPGIVLEVDEDLEALERLGITTLITLTERPFCRKTLKRAGLASLHFPIVDMEAPTSLQCADLMRVIEHRLGSGEVIAVHCKAGIGRTGTMLAAYLIWKGCTAEEALGEVRGINAKWVQSSRQEQFLQEFEHWLE